MQDQESEELWRFIVKHPPEQPICTDPECRCHENFLVVGILAKYVEDGLLTPDEATNILKGKTLWGSL